MVRIVHVFGLLTDLIRYDGQAMVEQMQNFYVSEEILRLNALHCGIHVFPSPLRLPKTMISTTATSWIKEEMPTPSVYPLSEQTNVPPLKRESTPLLPPLSTPSPLLTVDVALLQLHSVEKPLDWCLSYLDLNKKETLLGGAYEDLVIVDYVDLFCVVALRFIRILEYEASIEPPLNDYLATIRSTALEFLKVFMGFIHPVSRAKETACLLAYPLLIILEKMILSGEILMQVQLLQLLRVIMFKSQVPGSSCSPATQHALNHQFIRSMNHSLLGNALPSSIEDISSSSPATTKELSIEREKYKKSEVRTHTPPLSIQETFPPPTFSEEIGNSIPSPPSHNSSLKIPLPTPFNASHPPLPSSVISLQSFTTHNCLASPTASKNLLTSPSLLSKETTPFLIHTSIPITTEYLGPLLIVAVESKRGKVEEVEEEMEEEMEERWRKKWRRGGGREERWRKREKVEEEMEERWRKKWRRGGGRNGGEVEEERRGDGGGGKINRGKMPHLKVLSDHSKLIPTLLLGINSHYSEASKSSPLESFLEFCTFSLKYIKRSQIDLFAKALLRSFCWLLRKTSEHFNTTCSLHFLNALNAVITCLYEIESGSINRILDPPTETGMFQPIQAISEFFWTKSILSSALGRSSPISSPIEIQPKSVIDSLPEVIESCLMAVEMSLSHLDVTKLFIESSILQPFDTFEKSMGFSATSKEEEEEEDLFTLTVEFYEI
ncbi:hypothetical protein IE077_003104 [Cardiosporidium cionae]|uniref:Uncharacterized protein n=1 Tax=Cardiosporidium cionae TaxID=476202 RepID=A0ABQ7J4D4_9APIC|nr:hypothetical protein IE077_003104 [Cardiosporidium cionae]|eukprot:KAF8817886.1 hypothetical protein IE077_003104 [Cardiosporidium cionae]